MLFDATENEVYSLDQKIIVCFALFQGNYSYGLEGVFFGREYTLFIKQVCIKRRYVVITLLSDVSTSQWVLKCSEGDT